MRGMRRGFTIVELLVVVAIIAVLAGLLMPALNAALNRAHETATTSRMQQYEVAATLFFNDHGDYPPSTWNELDDLFGFDPDYEGWGTHPGNDKYDTIDEAWGDNVGYVDSSGNPFLDPRDYNEGIEVFLACVVTRQGGSYLEIEKGMVSNTDQDFDFDLEYTVTDYDDLGNPVTVNVPQDGEAEVFVVSNWVFGNADFSGPDPIYRPFFELTDWWGNPLAYFHNRDYYTLGPGGTPQSYVMTRPDDGVIVPVTAYDVDPDVGLIPRQNSFQMFSMGLPGENKPLTNWGS